MPAALQMIVNDGLATSLTDLVALEADDLRNLRCDRGHRDKIINEVRRGCAYTALRLR